MKNKALKRFYIFILTIVFIISLIILIENILFLYKEKPPTTSGIYDYEIITSETDDGENTRFSEKFNIDNESEEENPEVPSTQGTWYQNNEIPSIHSDIPILNYANDKLSGNSPNIILDSFIKIFPINQYVADAATTRSESSVETPKTVKDVLGIINNIRNDRRVLGGSIESIDNSDVLPVDVVEGGVSELEGEESVKTIDTQEVVGQINGEYFTVEQLIDRPFLYNNFYIIDSSTAVTDELFDAKVMLEKDFRLEQDSSKPQILIYHTHSQETFADSRPGVEEDTVVGVGARLAQILSEYGYNVIHDKTTYDIMGEGLDRNLAYNYANDGVTKILEENPSIEVCIDVHRDSGNKRVTTINGVETAQVMLFNGISTNAKGQPVDYLPNPNLQGNLAFSFQLQLKSKEAYPGFMFKNYLKSLRYNLHHRERSILAEVGTVSNTVGEAKNAMTYLGALINDVLKNK